MQAEYVYADGWYSQLIRCMSQEIFTKPTNFAELLHKFYKASVQLTAELQYNFRRACLPFPGMILCCSRVCPYPVNVFILLRGTSLLCCVRIWHTSFVLVAKPYGCPRNPYTYVGVHPPRAAFDDSTPTYIQYRYNDSTISITTSRLPFNYSRSTVQQFHGNHFMQFCGCLWWFWLRWCPSTNLQIPLTIPQIPFDDSTETLWHFCRWSVDYSCSESAYIVKFLVTCTVLSDCYNFI